MSNQKKDNSNRNAWIILIILIAIVFIALFIGGIISAMSEFIIETASTSSTTSSNSKASSSTSSKNTTTSSSHTYNMNEVVKTDYWQIHIISVDNKQELKRRYYGTKKTNNNYLLIKMKLKNISNQPNQPTRSITSVTNTSVGFQTSSIFEVHSGSAKYYSDYELESYIEDNYTLMFDTINPNTEVEYTVVIETDKPSTESSYILEVHDDSSYITKIRLY